MAALACPGTCESCVDAYQSWFCANGLLTLGTQCDGGCGDISSSHCRSYIDETDEWVGAILTSYRGCVDSFRMNCTADDQLSWQLFDNPTCEGACALGMETTPGTAVCQINPDELPASDDLNDDASTNDDWFMSDDDGKRYCPLSDDDVSKQKWRPCAGAEAASSQQQQQQQQQQKKKKLEGMLAATTRSVRERIVAAMEKKNSIRNG